MVWCFGVSASFTTFFSLEFIQVTSPSTCSFYYFYLSFFFFAFFLLLLKQQQEIEKKKKINKNLYCNFIAVEIQLFKKCISSI